VPFAATPRQQPRFDGDFSVAPTGGYVPTAAEEAYAAGLENVTTRLANEETHDRQLNQVTMAALVEAKRARRREATGLLRADADMFCAGTLAADIAADNTLVIWGRYTAARDRLLTSLFVVREQLNANRTLAVELTISVAQGLPPPNDTPSPEKQALFVAVASAQTTVRTVSQRMRDRASGFFTRNFGNPNQIRERADRLQDEYVRKLAGIGRLGLEGPHTGLAKLALDGMRQEFVAAEAGRIKNSYLRGLGLMAGIAVLVFVCLFSLVDTGYIQRTFWVVHKPFLLAGAGAAIGTWLSFSVRKVVLGFDDLGILEEDLLDPSLRVLFVVLLTLTACLLFWTQAMNIEIGMLKTSAFKGSTSFLVGVFAGLSERALATAVSGRATALVKSIAG
jgi:hypothetical protein